MIFWGVIVCGIGHVLIVAGGARQLIENGTAKIPFFIGVYILAIGAGKLATSPSSVRAPYYVNELTSYACSDVQAQRDPASPRPDQRHRASSQGP
jgi:dipeptide/tripeptide permease